MTPTISPAETSLRGDPIPRLDGDPRVSVVIPTRNRASLVGRAIRSALDQTFGDLEVIVVDDASTEETAEALASFTDPRLRVLRTARSVGCPGARNLAIGHARGEWVAFLDDDDEWLPAKLARQLERVAATPDPEPAVVYCSITIMRTGQQHLLQSPDHVPEGDMLRVLLEPGHNAFPSAHMVRRTALYAAGGCDEIFEGSADRDLWLRLAVAGYRFVSTSEPLAILHREHAKHVSGDPVLFARGMARYHRRWYGMAKTHLGAAAYHAMVLNDRRWIERMHRKHVKRLLRGGNRGRARRYVLGMAPVLRTYPWLSSHVARALVIVALGQHATRVVGVPRRRAYPRREEPAARAEADVA